MDMISSYKTTKKFHPDRNDREIIDHYMSQLTDKVETLNSETATDTQTTLYMHIQTIHERASAMVSIALPSSMRPRTAKNGRTLPDFGQKINIAEIRAKKRMLIADEMGLGKSASVIIAKEMMGVRQAIIIAPKNVIPTWQ
jgi:hypothetical protein